ncbi:hypothetical protein SLH46_18775 [Draconibacterium sp. IB214405]|uniref:hypothetical protein n=1 Tax=Draconibacterium sp. IB214405 TaxID=3097352 RepID=UPI002A0EE6E0|nr:hypothetical protein [Draconibacterium sp. IB214405]MDX8341251.1 hypothetical protein [Draconibacterium sp. IB214405]
MKRNYIKISLIVLCLLTSTCKTISTNLPKPANLQEYTKGMWMECEITDGSKAEGEILVIDDKQVLLLTSYGLTKTVNKNVITKARIDFSLTTNYPEKLQAADFIPVLAISHGVFMVITLPINLMIVVPTVSTHRRGSYAVEYPAKISWGEISKFARFPQGVPEGIDYTQLRTGNY